MVDLHGPLEKKGHVPNVAQPPGQKCKPNNNNSHYENCMYMPVINVVYGTSIASLQL